MVGSCASAMCFVKCLALISYNPSKEDTHFRFPPYLLQKQQSGETVLFIMQVNTKTKGTAIDIAKNLIDWAPEIFCDWSAAMLGHLEVVCLLSAHVDLSLWICSFILLALDLLLLTTNLLRNLEFLSKLSLLIAVCSVEVAWPTIWSSGGAGWVISDFGLPKPWTEDVLDWRLCAILPRKITWKSRLEFTSCPVIGENRQLVTDEPVEFEDQSVEVQDCRRITDHFTGIYGIYTSN